MDGEVSTKPQDVASLAGPLAELASLLKESNLDLIYNFQNLKDNLKNFCQPKEFFELEKAVKIGEFDQALEYLRRLATRLNIKIE